MKGRLREDLLEIECYRLAPTEWMRMGTSWVARTPPNRTYPNGAIADLSNHEVTANDDGTITVSPSILVTGIGKWHGYLINGVWSEV